MCQLTNLRINVEFFELNGAEFYVAVVAEIVQPLVLGTPGLGLPTQGRVIVETNVYCFEFRNSIQ